MKVLVLVIYSEEVSVYKEHLECWRKYSRSHPCFDVFFITLSNKVENITLANDMLFIPGEESLKNITYKTVKAFEVFQAFRYDFVLRTNLSSFWIFENLLPVLETFPKEGLLAGELINGDMVSGAGMFLTWDLCRLLVQTYKHLENYQVIWPDDARISHFLRELFQVRFLQTSPSRFDILENPKKEQFDAIPLNTFHIRVRVCDEKGDRSLEPQIMNQLYDRFYLKKLNTEHC